MSTKVSISAPIKISDSALEQLKRIRVEQEIPDTHMIRVGVKGGGCSGLSYVLGFDDKTDNDDVFEIEGLQVIMDRGHALHLLGIEIDWLNGLNNRGFVFNNPNATDTCGCGSSFSTE